MPSGSSNLIPLSEIARLKLLLMAHQLRAFRSPVVATRALLVVMVMSDSDLCFFGNFLGCFDGEPQLDFDVHGVAMLVQPFGGVEPTF